MSIITSMLSKMFGAHELRTLFLGIDATGRTTALYRLKLNELVTTVPTIGFNVEDIEYRGTTFQFWDVGGCDKIRPLWRHYYANTKVLIFCVDSGDRERLRMTNGQSDPFSTSEGAFKETMAESALQECIVLILANKQDIPGCLTVEEVSEALNVEQYREQGRTVNCMGCCALTGEGLHDGLQWVLDGD
jgi:ADP-ribosylation factor protein 1